MTNNNLQSLSLLLNTLPNDLRLLIGKTIHRELLTSVHHEFKNLYQIGVSTMIVRNNEVGNRRRRRKIFAFINIDSSPDFDAPRICKFHELSKDVIKVPEIKGWERAAFNYRNLDSLSTDDQKYTNFNPKMFCIRNGNRNTGVLPPRYFYSKPINPKKYHEFETVVKQFIQQIPTSKFIRGGDL